MKMICSGLMAIALFSTPASALTIFGLTVTAPVVKDHCMPAIGNWVNAAKISCPDNGSGFAVGNGYGKPLSKCESKHR